MEIRNAVRDILLKIGESPDREGLIDTPARVDRNWRFLTRGYLQNEKEEINNAYFEEYCNDMIIVKDIEFYSMCERHLLPFYGKCHIGYIPKGKILGVSKLARIVDMFAKRLQLQERLTKQVAETIQNAINPEGVGVVMEAQYMCMMIKGVKKQNSKMHTSTMLGNFKKGNTTRMEFFNQIKR